MNLMESSLKNIGKNPEFDQVVKNDGNIDSL